MNSLLAAVAANPLDDLPRLVYADWLDEQDGTEECPCAASGYAYGDTCLARCGRTGSVRNSNAARAEFIRLMQGVRPFDVFWARHGLRDRGLHRCWNDARGGGPVIWEPPTAADERAASLLLDHHDRWFPEGLNGLRVWGGWVKGFVTEVSGQLDLLLECLPGLVVREPVARVRVSDREPYHVDHPATEWCGVSDFYRWWAFADPDECPPEYREVLLPADVYEILRTRHPFGTPGAAEDALSDTLLAWAYRQPSPVLVAG